MLLLCSICQSANTWAAVLAQNFQCVNTSPTLGNEKLGEFHTAHVQRQHHSCSGLYLCHYTAHLYTKHTSSHMHIHAFKHYKHLTYLKLETCTFRVLN